jgi:hypothetical protein
MTTRRHEKFVYKDARAHGCLFWKKDNRCWLFLVERCARNLIQFPFKKLVSDTTSTTFKSLLSFPFCCALVRLKDWEARKLKSKSTNIAQPNQPNNSNWYRKHRYAASISLYASTHLIPGCISVLSAVTCDSPCLHINRGALYYHTPHYCYTCTPMLRICEMPNYVNTEAVSKFCMIAAWSWI